MSPSRLAFLMAGALAATACSSPSAPSLEPVSFASTITGGYCVPLGPCIWRLEVSAEQAVLTSSAGLLPPTVRRRALEPAEWRRLLGATDAARLQALSSSSGCLGCNDLAETLRVVYADGQSSSVTFEYNDDLPGIEALLAELRAIRRSLDAPPGALHDTARVVAVEAQARRPASEKGGWIRKDRSSGSTVALRRRRPGARGNAGAAGRTGA